MLAVVIAIPSDFNFSSTKENQNFDYKKITYCQIGFRKFNEYTYIDMDICLIHKNNFMLVAIDYKNLKG